MSAEGNGRERLLARPANLDFLLTNRTAFLRRFLRPGDQVLEIGAGLGIVSTYVKHLRLVSSDIQPKPWLDVVADGMRLPFADARFDAVVCLHVLHHLARPRQGIEEMLRVVRPGGRLLIAEPHASWSLRVALALTRHESVDWNVDPFGPDTCQTRGDGNNAIPDLMFGDLDRFLREFPGLTVEHDRFVECVTFLNSGGVTRRSPHLPLPRYALRWCGWLDDRLVGLERVFAMGRELVFQKP